MLAFAGRGRGRDPRATRPGGLGRGQYDGIRAQLQPRGSDVRLYCATNDVSTQFPEVVDALGRSAWTGLIDGEILAWKDGLVLLFQSLQPGLAQVAIGRDPPRSRSSMSPSTCWPSGRATIPTAMTVEPLLRSRSASAAASTRWSCRRSMPAAASRSHLAVADEDALETAFADSLGPAQRGPDGQGPDEHLPPGRRGLGWLKMKKALATIDCVVVGVEVGHGKRHGVLSDYTFAVRDMTSGKLGEHRRPTQRPDRRRDRRDDEAGSRRTPSPSSVATGRSSRPSSSRSRSTSSSAASATARASACASRASPHCDPTSSVDEIDTVETVTALYEGLQHGSSCW